METLDAVTLFISGASIGFIGGHWFCKRTDGPLEYSRGKLDGVNELWPHLVSAWIDAAKHRRIADARGQAAGDVAGDQKTVH
jgi:hypothetical protein